MTHKEVNIFQAKLLRRDQISENTFRLEFTVLDRLFSFEAGQYIWLKVNRLLSPDPRGERRAFSIASGPQKDTIAIIFRNSKSGYKKTLLELPLGSPLEIIGPCGFFISPANADRKIIFISGGVGVAPFLSVIQDSLEKKDGRKIHLIYSESDKKFLIPEVLELQEKAKNSGFLKISINIGPLTDEFIAANTENDVRSFWYFAGPPGMVETLAPLVFQRGVPRDHMHFEEFYPFFPFEEKLDLSKRDEAEPLDIYKLAVDASPFHMMITDVNGIILYANEATVRITGFKISEMLGNTARLWGGLMEPAFYKELWVTKKIERVTYKGKARNRKKDGEHYIAELTIAPILKPNGNLIGFVASERDITELERIDKTKSEFVSLVAHQLRTPLSAVNWYSEMLLEKEVGTLETKQMEYLNEVYKGSQRMVKIVDALLDVSRMEIGTFAIEPVLTDILVLAQNAINEAMPLIKKKKLILIEKHTDNIPMLRIDPKLLQTVFQNLLDNAVKYTLDEGKIEFSIFLDAKKENMLINVSDNGFGIPKDQQSKIFDKLFRADNIRDKDTDGTGLGLYMTKAIVDLSGGAVWFESEENKGTAIHVSLPINAKPHEKSQ